MLKPATVFLPSHVPICSALLATSHLIQKCLKLLTFQDRGLSIPLSLFHTVRKQFYAFLLTVIPLSLPRGTLALACRPPAAMPCPSEWHSCVSGEFYSSSLLPLLPGPPAPACPLQGAAGCQPTFCQDLKYPHK